MADTKTVTETKKMTETKTTTETKTNTITKISCLKGYVPSCLFLTPVTSVLHMWLPQDIRSSNGSGIKWIGHCGLVSVSFGALRISWGAPFRNLVSPEVKTAKLFPYLFSRNLVSVILCFEPNIGQYHHLHINDYGWRRATFYHHTLVEFLVFEMLKFWLENFPCFQKM